jgi:diacylglycerol kinase
MKKQSIVSAFGNAFSGIIFCITHERNMKIHIGATIAVALLAWWFRLEKYELYVLLITIVIVYITEMMNTVIEVLVDLVSPEFHPLAKIAKDVAAGMVLVAALFSLIIGYMLFISKIWN